MPDGSPAVLLPLVVSGYDRRRCSAGLSANLGRDAARRLEDGAVAGALRGRCRRHLTADWIERVGSECGQKLKFTPDAIRAVKELIRPCQLGIREGEDVVHTWYL